MLVLGKLGKYLSTVVLKEKDNWISHISVVGGGETGIQNGKPAMYQSVCMGGRGRNG